MKKNLLTLFALAGLMSAANAQIGWVQTGGTVKVEPNTLKYVEIDYKVTGGQTLNEGNVNVRGNFDASTNSAEKGETKGFHNVWTARNAYGQLIIQNGKTVTGKVENQYNLPSGFSYQPIAFPFDGYSGDDAHSDVGLTANYLGYDNSGSDDGFDPGRYQATLWTWHNAASGDASSFYFETESASRTLEPELYHGYNNMSNLNNGTKGFIGQPHNDNVTVTANPYTMTTAWDVNDRGEQYGSYVDDVAIERPTGWALGSDITGEDDGVAAGGYGDNISLFGNPFTSNMKLTGADGNTTLTNVTHVFYIAQNTYTGDEQGTSSGSNVYVTTFDGGVVATGQGALEASALTVRPQETFYVKTDGGVANIALNEATKTFEAKGANHVGITSRTSNSNNGFYQAALDVYDAEGVNTNTRTYVFASDRVNATERSQFEAYNTAVSNTLGLYSLQENNDGTVYADLADQKVLINGVNATDYVAKPIVLGFNGVGTFTFKSILTSNLISSGNRFYFEDKQTGTILEVTPDFEYTFTSTENTEDRFAMYWNDLPQTLAVDDVALVEQTIIFKDNDQFKVRFAKSWNNAEVYVYNALGQLVHTAKKVNTSNDYLLPLSKTESSAYIVKAVNENGEVSTKKIIK